VTSTDTADDTRAQALRDARFASLQGCPKSKAATALVEAVFNQVAAYENEHATYQHKPGSPVHAAVGAFLADLLVAQSETSPSPWVHRALHAQGFTGGPIGHRGFTRSLAALKGLRLVEHAEGFAEITRSAFEVTEGYQVVGKAVAPSVTNRWASRFRATDALLQLAERRRVRVQSSHKHFAFQYELPKRPLQKRMTNAKDNYYSRKQVRGRLMAIDPTEVSTKLEADVRELNEFLERQQIEGGVHHGYIRIYQNGDAAGFDWNYGGRIYSQPPADNYQQMSKKARLKMTFNGEAVAEIDIRASYLTLFYGWHGKQLDLNSDPYLLPGFGRAGRDAVKLWMVATFGSSKPISRWPTALLKDYDEDRAQKFDRKRYSVKRVREKALLKHPLIKGWGESYKGRTRTWADLMNEESVVMVSAMVELMRDHGIPSLAVHDSLIVARSKISIAREVLEARFHSVTGMNTQLIVKPVGLAVS
jgi:hypothetical protein